MLLTLIAAAKAGKTCVISYDKGQGVLSVREIEPYEIKREGDKTYLFGYCLQQGGIRKFDLSKIKQVVPTENAYSPRWPLKLD